MFAWTYEYHNFKNEATSIAEGSHGRLKKILIGSQNGVVSIQEAIHEFTLISSSSSSSVATNDGLIFLGCLFLFCISSSLAAIDVVVRLHLRSMLSIDDGLAIEKVFHSDLLLNNN